MEVVGLVSYSFLWPAAGVTRSLYLKELYVLQSYQRKVIGKALMDRVCEIAAEQGCSRVEWTTDQDNEVAKRFYEHLGYPPFPEKVFYRVELTHPPSRSHRRMTRTLVISVPDDVAQRLDREPNVSAFIAETVRGRMVSERVRESLVQAGFTVTDEGLARAGAELDELHAAITPELHRQAAQVRARISCGKVANPRGP